MPSPLIMKVYISPLGDDVTYAGKVFEESLRQYGDITTELVIGEPDRPAGDGRFYAARIVVIVLRSRYHVGEVRESIDSLSTGHLEYRAARQQGIPVVVLIQRELFEAWASFQAGQRVTLPASERGLFPFLTEITGYDQQLGGRNPWIGQFGSIYDLRRVVDSVLAAFDDFAIEGEEPEFEVSVRAGERFEKTWFVRNTGLCHWTERELRLLPGMAAKLGEHTMTRRRVPPARPGEVVPITVRFTAPNRRGRFTLLWGLYSRSGERYVPSQRPLSCVISVL